MFGCLHRNASTKVSFNHAEMTAAKVRLAMAAMGGTKGNESDGFMQRTGYYPANALPARRARWDAAQGWAEGS
jgi:hypothetical protein